MHTLKLDHRRGPVAGLGLVLAVLRQLPGRPLAPIRWLAIGHIDVFRGILLLVLLLVSGFLSSAASPVEGERFRARSVRPNGSGQPSPFWYGIIALTITYGAYMAEVYRAGIEAVSAGRRRRACSA